jgi:hypothetical protein
MTSSVHPECPRLSVRPALRVTRDERTGCIEGLRRTVCGSILRGPDFLSAAQSAVYRRTRLTRHPPIMSRNPPATDSFHVGNTATPSGSFHIGRDWRFPPARSSGNLGAGADVSHARLERS